MATYAIPFRTFTDKRALPASVADYFAIPGGTGTFTVRTVEIPKTGGTWVIREVDPITKVFTPGTHKVFTIISSGTPGSNDALVDATTYITGEVGFAYTGNIGKMVELSYLGGGSTLFAQDINDLSSGVLIKDGAILARHLNISSLVLNGNLTVAGAFRISGTQPLYLGKLSSDPTPNSTNLGGIYYHMPDKQFKGIAEAAVSGTYKVVILG